MGTSSSIKCVPVRTFEARRTSSYRLKGTSSFSNPSLEKLQIVESSSIQINYSQQFTADYMQQMFMQYKHENKLDNTLSDDVIRLVTAIIETLSMDDHILFIANNFFERFYNDDHQYISLFNNCLANNDITQFDNKNYLLEHHMILHIMFFFRIHQFILTTLGDGKEDKAYEILDLVALSHLVMRVDASSFKQHVLNLIQVILHFNLISEDQLPPFVYYLLTIVGYVCTMMKKYEERTSKFSKGTDGNNSAARDNYRELKKWKVTVMSLTESLRAPIIELEEQMEDEKTKIHTTTGQEDEEKWQIIRLLKKGYKYRNEVPSDVLPNPSNS